MASRLRRRGSRRCGARGARSRLRPKTFLDGLTESRVAGNSATLGGRPVFESNGTLLQRVIYHYWFHIGESQAIRQMLGHENLPQFVGDLGDKAPYRTGN